MELVVIVVTLLAFGCAVPTECATRLLQESDRM